MTAEHPPRYLTAAQVADYIHTPISTLHYWRTLRPVYGPPAVKVGRRLLYRESEVVAWLEDLHSREAKRA